ncbi:MAG: ADP-ribose pyrophosphatase [Candidatus Woesebacteria bacterium GW2011_GWB1_38_5]|uniref:ADP-ribose pyrophosphatase n=4 Tax=Candidatus Woeseibacteriota TaxID=1752722 RepID=A0A0G0MKZ2_9BACT|nr:MAG: ADP-ribose pyrophosphatase [Candidatus Woesebacteria bacterium GW2011_GWD1_38_10]KKQ55578.1 MAG: ADP-ribose pyrophosphatase [Candidatus Woesebacteria bacterium GW2011_GWC1_38_13]KKQ74399.1 MAG: ADP-ribose pyrophosphatase [Candidatus Woesebacteria bacterium GW2011_GWB1_38_5]KKQ84471.1 MAG: ADP-ribose pyrophosphatase [Candidatus Woesebacteria bacterium GW2011_GWA1_38_8]
MKIDKSWYIKPKDPNYPTQNLAGGVVIREDNGKLLIALVGDKKFSTFILPKGKVENNETSVTAAKREIAEETGLHKLVIHAKLGVKERMTFDKTSWNIYDYFLFSTKQIFGKIKPNEDEKDFFLEWFDLENLPPIFWPEQKDLIEENREKIKLAFFG